MSPAFPMRRRADDFDRAVEAAADSASARPEGELAELVALVADLRELPVIEPPAAFSADLRERLMTAAATELAPAAARAAEESTVAEKLTVRRLADPTRSGRRQRRLTAAIAVVALLGGTAGTAFASRGSLPGDTLYPVKRAVENVQAGFSVSDRSKGTTILGDADTRLSEVRKLTQTRPANDPAHSAQVRKTLETFSTQATKASDLLLSDYRQHQDQASIRKLRTFTAGGIDELAALGAVVPEQAKGALSDAAQTLVLIDQAAAALCAECGGGISELPSSLLSSLSTTLDQLAPGLVQQGSGDTTPEATGPKQGKQPGDQKAPTGQKKDSQPGLTLPSVDPNSLLPGSVSGDGSGTTAKDGSSSKSGSKSSTSDSKSGGSGSTKKGSGSGSTGGGSGSGDPTSAPTSVGDALDDTVNGVVSGVGGLVGGVVGGLTGGLTGSK